MMLAPFMREDIEGMDVQFAQLDDVAEIGEEALAVMEASESYTLINEGEVIACMGFVPIWPNRAWVWAILSKNAKKYALSVTRTAKELLAGSAFDYVEAYIRSEHEDGGRFVRALGFDCLQMDMPGFMKPGIRYDFYMRVK